MSYNLMFLKWRLDMGLTFDGIIELKTDINPTALTPDSHHLNNESRIIAPLFTVKAPLIKTDDMATEGGWSVERKMRGRMVQRMTHFWPHYTAGVSIQ